MNNVHITATHVPQDLNNKIEETTTEMIEGVITQAVKVVMVEITVMMKEKYVFSVCLDTILT